jgi:hypothetical protein
MKNKNYTHKCPSDQTLIELAIGQVGASEVMPLLKHLAVCPECRRLVWATRSSVAHSAKPRGLPAEENDLPDEDEEGLVPEPIGCQGRRRFDLIPR